MNIKFIEIQNFRKLKTCRIGISKEETIFVGANNSGKTSAMDCLILFLKKNRRKEIVTTDFTMSNWSHINKIGLEWVNSKDENKPDLMLEKWLPYLPSIDIWLNVTDFDIHYIIHLIPTLDWTPDQLLGIRLLFAPKNIEILYKDFRNAHIAARLTENSASTNNNMTKLSLWPESMRDFLDRELHNHFEVKAFILDPSQFYESEGGSVKPQPLPAESEPIVDKDPIGDLFKIDVISAQRGFSDPNTEDISRNGFASLSSQLRQYFSKHLDPCESPDTSDIEALQAIETAKTVFDDKLKTSFKPAISELEGLNYPGFSDPQITLTSKIRTVDSLDHDTAVQFIVAPACDDCTALSLPEQYNGLGYQNLISMVFNLIRFRDEWMRVGKAANNQKGKDSIIEPLHLVLIEEPEAHLHPQVQQVFIKKAYKVLRNNKKITDNKLSTQIIISTHSSHIAHELDFTCLRYFRREPAMHKGETPLSTVVSLSKTFGDDNETSKFAKRYIKTTHCDLFFADAAILVEGTAERMLLPHFIRQPNFSKLNQSYISILEIGGSHAHRLKPLLETLGLLSLIITDLDSISKDNAKKVFPERKKGYRTGNTTLKTWIPNKKELDELLNCPDNEKQSENKLRVAYQCPIQISYKDGNEKEEAIPYTFEDSLALTNLNLFRNFMNPKGLLEEFKESLNEPVLSDACKKMFESIKIGTKAEMALDLLFITDPDNLLPPAYISDGLKWLEKKLSERQQEFLDTATMQEKNA